MKNIWILLSVAALSFALLLTGCQSPSTPSDVSAVEPVEPKSSAVEPVEPKSSASETPAPEKESSLAKESEASSEAPASSTSSSENTSSAVSSSTAQSTDDSKLIDYAVAIKEFETQYPNAVITEVKSKFSLGQPVVEVEGLDTSMEYEVYYDAQGMMLQEKIETADRDAAQEMEYKGFASADTASLLSIDRAIDIAQQERNGKPKSVKLSKSKGVLYYEVEVIDGNKDWEITMKADDGTVVEIDD